MSHCFQGIVGNSRDINYNNLTKEAPNVNKFTRFFCVAAMASVVREAAGAGQQQASQQAVHDLEASIEGNVGPLNVAVVARPSRAIQARMLVAETACRMVHDPPCLFWQGETWGEIPTNVRNVRWNEANPPPDPNRGYGRGRGRRGRGRGRGRARVEIAPGEGAE